jgi:hypothetical protein
MFPLRHFSKYFPIRYFPKGTAAGPPYTNSGDIKSRLTKVYTNSGDIETTAGFAFEKSGDIWVRILKRKPQEHVSFGYDIETELT